jgi:hypothetical protein
MGERTFLAHDRGNLTMTAAADAYDRPPYRAPSPARPGGPGAWVLEILLPWRLARRIYGPFSMPRFAGSVMALAGLGPYATPVATLADPVIERLLLPRALLGLGVVVAGVGLLTGADAPGLLDVVLGDLLILATAPLALPLACVPLVVLARHGTRWRVTQLVARPLATGLITATVCALLVAGTGGRAEHLLGSVFWEFASLAFTPWVVTFFACSLYLMHRNAFSVGGHPLVRPLASIPLAWLTALGHAFFYDSAWYTYRPTHGYLLALSAGPFAVTVISVIEVVLLRRRHGVGFRGPLPGWEPPPWRMTPLPGDLVGRLWADVARGHGYTWRQFTDRNGVVWAATPFTWADQTVMWPCVHQFTDETRPMIRSDVETTAGPLTPR